MKNSEIHKGYIDRELRDYFSNQLVDLYFIDLKQQKELSNENIWDDSIMIIKTQIHNSKLELKRAENMKALHSLLEIQGWEEFDVSDYITKDSSSYKSFIGTEKEYNIFINKSFLR